MNKDLAEISKFLSYVLRHEPDALGITLNAEGWTDIALLVTAAASAGQSLDYSLINTIVNTNEKKRFAISEDGLRIRASQGHSTKSVAINYLGQLPPALLYHGTASRFIEAIRKEGLLARSRHHVHLSEDVTTAISVGQRHGSPVVLKIEALRMHKNGFKFFKSENGVWLVEAVPFLYIGAQ